MGVLGEVEGRERFLVVGRLVFDWLLGSRLFIWVIGDEGGKLI